MRGNDTSQGTALHLVIITEAAGAAGVALALGNILGQDLATRVGDLLFSILDAFGGSCETFGRQYYGELL